MTHNRQRLDATVTVTSVSLRHSDGSSPVPILEMTAQIVVQDQVSHDPVAVIPVLLVPERTGLIVMRHVTELVPPDRHGGFLPADQDDALAARNEAITAATGSVIDIPITLLQAAVDRYADNCRQGAYDMLQDIIPELLYRNILGRETKTRKRRR